MEQRTAPATIKPIEFYHDNFEERILIENIAIRSIYSFVLRDKRDRTSAVISAAIQDTLASDTPERELLRIAFKDQDYQTAYELSGVVESGLIRLDRAIEMKGSSPAILQHGYLMNIDEHDPFDPRITTVGFDLPLGSEQRELVGAQSV